MTDMVILDSPRVTVSFILLKGSFSRPFMRECGLSNRFGCIGCQGSRGLRRNCYSDIRHCAQGILHAGVKRSTRLVLESPLTLVSGRSFHRGPMQV